MKKYIKDSSFEERKAALAERILPHEPCDKQWQRFVDAKNDHELVPVLSENMGWLRNRRIMSDVDLFIPDGLTVDEWLDLEGCTALTELRNAHIKGNLWMRGMNINLVNVQVDGNIYDKHEQL